MGGGYWAPIIYYCRGGTVRPATHTTKKLEYLVRGLQKEEEEAFASSVVGLAAAAITFGSILPHTLLHTDPCWKEQATAEREGQTREHETV